MAFVIRTSVCGIDSCIQSPASFHREAATNEDTRQTGEEPLGCMPSKSINWELVRTIARSSIRSLLSSSRKHRRRPSDVARGRGEVTQGVSSNMLQNSWKGDSQCPIDVAQ